MVVSQTLKFGVNGLVVCYYKAQSAGIHVSQNLSESDHT
jgi:hypothetical protein